MSALAFRFEIIVCRYDGVLGVEVCAIRQTNVVGGISGKQYCTLTQNDGTYVIDKIYYGTDEDGATFTIVPARTEADGLVHEFAPENSYQSQVTLYSSLCLPVLYVCTFHVNK